MVKYFHLGKNSTNQVVSEITEGEYEFRLRKHGIIPGHLCEEFLAKPGHWFETRYGICVAVEVPNAS